MCVICFLPFSLFGDDISSITTPKIIQGTLSAVPSCLHYKVIGICFWQQCNASGCTVTTTPKVEHYLPDAVVSVYRQADSNPWDYAKTIIDPNAKQIGSAQSKTLLNYNMGIGNENNSQLTNQNTHFKEVDVKGCIPGVGKYISSVDF